MRIMKGFPMIPSNRLWILCSAVALITWSQLSHIGKLSNTSYANLLPRRTPSKGADAPPILAYWIMGSRGENKRILRLLKGIYHPRNQYLLQLDSASPDQQRTELAVLVHSESVFREFGNVNVVGQSYGINPMAASGLAAVLHAAALLLRVNADWDWFIPLSTSDYPILSQDDILYAFSSLPRDVIFMGLNNGTSWEKEKSRIVVDPNLYLTKSSSILYAVETREKPDAFQIFGGSSWMVLTRGFLEHSVNGWDNLPRKLLMYFNNVVFPLQSYFQTLLCNTPQFQNTTLLNHTLRKNMSLTDLLIPSPAIFATPFREDDPLMQEIDEKLLKRDADKVVPGKWCIQVNDSCSFWGDIDAVKPGPQGLKLRQFFSQLMKDNNNLASSQCQTHNQTNKL